MANLRYPNASSSRSSTTGKSCMPNSTWMVAAFGFVTGCLTSATVVMNFALIHTNTVQTTVGVGGTPPSLADVHGVVSNSAVGNNVPVVRQPKEETPEARKLQATNSLQGLRILVAIASYDFSQIPHLEEVLDVYQDLCVTGATKVHLVVHATVAFPVTWIDMLNSRLIPSCEGIFELQIELVPASLRLHLVDCHRPMFYERINDYDLFIYTEDDIRVSPRTVAAYWDETQRVQKELGPQRASDFNVGIVRYEYNFPSNVVMDDKTRHATQNVTRVYWEHGQFPLFNKGMSAVPAPEFSKTHVHMQNHHQGMFLATRELLLAWKDRKGCNFDQVRDRPGLKKNPAQPSEGTQRVWMSSQMLFGGRHCNVQQIIPAKSFGAFTVLHLPNKNYRRVGHFQNRTFSDGTERFDFGATGSLLTAMKLHIELRKHLPATPIHPYRGITMVDKVHKRRTPLLERRMAEYQAYVDRGGVLSEEDMERTLLVEDR